MNPNETYPEFNKKLVEALRSVSGLEGVGYFNDAEELGVEDGLLINARHMDNYLLVGLLAHLIENGHVELKINPSINPERYDYLLRLLKLKKRGE